LNASLFISAVVNLVFLVVNLFFDPAIYLFTINTALFVFSSYALYILREKRDYKRAVIIGNSILFTAFIALSITQQGANFTFIWTYFFTPFAILTLGASRGLVVAFTFIVTILAITYTGIDVWQEGVWDTKSYLRFFVAHFLMLYIIYAFQNSNERANEKIEEMRIKEKQQLKLFEKLSITDALTSLYNRRFLDEIFPRQIHAARRNGKLFAFFILDLDYFKQYNDSYGHQKGDWALEQVSLILKEHLRRSEDYAFRMGGEEFAGIVLGEDIEGLKSAINDIHKAIQAQNIEHSSSKVSPVLTCSIGVCVVDDTLTYDFKEVYQLADNALYMAKGSGRNKIVYAD